MKNDEDDHDFKVDDVCPECHILKVNGECMCDFW